MTSNMYPPKENEPISKDNATDFVRYLERLMILMVRHSNRSCDEPIPASDSEELEITRRALIDYLLATDPRKGVYVSELKPMVIRKS